MNIECAYSFSDLYNAAYGRTPTPDEMELFNHLDQHGKNDLVSVWAAKAGWETKKRIGDDGLEYLAFAPSFKTE